ncbi:hypothetical protein [Ramlibacter pallidus]|nr:hypothetical protein [Ramlibacter pallidus]
MQGSTASRVRRRRLAWAALAALALALAGIAAKVLFTFMLLD